MFNSKRVWIIVAIVGASAIGYYIYKKAYDTSNLLSHVPSDAAFVLTADFKSLSGKLNYEKLKTMNFYQQAKKGAERSRGDESKFISKLMNDPFSSGVNFLKDAFFFAANKNGRSAYALIFEISDSKDFLALAMTIPGANSSVPLKEGDNTYIELDQSSILAWSHDIGVIISGIREGKEKYASEILDMNRDASMASNSAYKASMSKDYDLGCFLSFDGLATMMAAEREDFVNLGKYPGATVCMRLNFEESEVVMETEVMDPSGKVKEENILASSGVSAKLMNRVTGKDVITGASVSVNTQKIIELLKSTPLFSRGIENLSDELGMSIEQIGEAFSGEFTFAMTGLEEITYTRETLDYSNSNYLGPWQEPTHIEEEVKETIPTYVFTFTSAKPEIIDSLAARARAVKRESYWAIPMEGINMYIVKSEGCISVTNSQTSTEELTKAGSFQATPNEKVQGLFTTYPFVYYVNLNLDSYPSEFQNLVQKLAGPRAYGQFSGIIKNLEDFTITANGTNGKAVLRFRGGEGNSLFRLINMLDDASMMR